MKIEHVCGVMAICAVLCGTALAADANVLVEAEGFKSTGGWVIDQQFMDQMGSPYLLAHGLGEPVGDAVTTVRFPAPGAYRVWVRTRDWVAPWKAPGAPGRFKLLVDGKALAATFGTEGAEWHWQDGGNVTVGPEAHVALHDLTGFEGRCDAVLFCADPGFQPPNEAAPLAVMRRQLLGLPERPDDGGSYELVVVGGGIAGTCAALSAARLGLTVALVQDRPVLGGNNSSEVRVWLNGNIRQQPYPRIGDIVAELEPKRRAHAGAGNTADLYEDDRRLALVRSQPGLTLLAEQRVNAVEAQGGVLRVVVAQHTRTARRTRLAARWFADCTGDGAVGALAGADFEVTRKRHMGPSNLWNVRETGQPQPFPKCECEDTNPVAVAVAETKSAAPFPRCPWAVDLRDKPFPGRPAAGQKKAPALDKLGQWYWESGFDRDPIAEVEWMRDQNLRAMYGAWDTLKNVDKLYPNHKLNWAAYIAGKRESRRLLGDVVLTAEDFRTNRVFSDGCFPCTWGIDLHFADPAFQKGHEGAEFISNYTRGGKYSYKRPYWAPYRCLYSRNISNLFMAGRDISVTHEALGPVRVMRTCGMMGEVVGMAASLCRKHACNPRDVYEKHLAEFKELLKTGVANVLAKDSILAVMHKVNAYQLEHPWRATDRNWIRATYYTGVMAAYHATKDERYLEQAIRWGAEHQWQPGSEHSGGNKLTCGQTWIALYAIKKDPQMIAPLIKWLDSGQPNAPTGAKVWYLEGGRRYADSLYVGPPTLAMLAEATGDRKYLKYMDDFYWDVYEEIFDKEVGLFYRDKRFIAVKTPNGKTIFWSRGNGWVIAGLPRILGHLPKNHATYPRYVGLFKRMSVAIAACQGEDGLWRPNLADAEEFPMPETSGTGFFVYAMAWGINNKILDRGIYLPVVRKGWAGLVRSVSSQGKVQWGQQVGDRPVAVKQEDSHEYVTGTFLLAGSEVLGLNGGENR